MTKKNAKLSFAKQTLTKLGQADLGRVVGGLSQKCVPPNPV